MPSDSPTLVKECILSGHQFAVATGTMLYRFPAVDSGSHREWIPEFKGSHCFSVRIPGILFLKVDERSGLLVHSSDVKRSSLNDDFKVGSEGFIRVQDWERLRGLFEFLENDKNTEVPPLYQESSCRFTDVKPSIAE